MVLEGENCYTADSETATSTTLNTVCWLPQAKHRQAQHFGKFKWNLWMHCFIFPVRCTQIQEQFYMDFLTSPGTFMIEEDAIHSKEIVGLSEVHHNPVGIQFCCPYKNNWRRYIHLLHLCTHTYRHRHIYTFLFHAGWRPCFSNRVR